MTKINKLMFMLAVASGLLVLAPVLASAQSLGTSVTATASVGSTSVSASGSATLTAAEQKAVARGNQEITRRITALNALNTRVQAMQEVTATFKQGLEANIQTEVSALTALQAKIDADTTLATLKTDIQSITASYRIFALILPQGRIAAAADRAVTIVNMMSTLGSKLQARIQAAPSGSDTTALTAALTDMSSKLQDAQTQAEAAVTATASLQPDNGVASVEASNTAALKTGRTDIQTATSDLQAARKEITTIVNGLKAFPASTSAAASASSTTSTQ